ncbi:MAG TPA: hypothetical protein VFP84_12380, partial [Kofleriaceae bacterium]|nr:hypothetical protein [Kofleriaceae bacterium]
SLPSLQRGGGPTPAGAYAPPGSRPQLGAKPPTGPGAPGSRPPMAPGVNPMAYPVQPMAHQRSGRTIQPGNAAPSGYPQAQPQMNGHAAPIANTLPGQGPGAGSVMNGHMASAQRMSSQAQRLSGQAANGGPMPGMPATHPSQSHLPSVGHSGPLHTAPGAGNYAYGAPGMAAAPPKSNAIVFVLIAILVVAIAVLAYLVITK